MFAATEFAIATPCRPAAVTPSFPESEISKSATRVSNLESRIRSFATPLSRLEAKMRNCFRPTGNVTHCSGDAFAAAGNAISLWIAGQTHGDRIEDARKALQTRRRQQDTAVCNMASDGVPRVEGYCANLSRLEGRSSCDAVNAFSLRASYRWPAFTGWRYPYDIHRSGQQGSDFPVVRIREVLKKWSPETGGKCSNKPLSLPPVGGHSLITGHLMADVALRSFGLIFRCSSSEVQKIALNT